MSACTSVAPARFFCLVGASAGCPAVSLTAVKEAAAAAAEIEERKSPAAAAPRIRLDPPPPLVSDPLPLSPSATGGAIETAGRRRQSCVGQTSEDSWRAPRPDVSTKAGAPFEALLRAL